ncbi:MAG: hypothetical protein FWF10_10700 [Clostridiales bacterium]|nr:hypothetical protein [Clostridiales bacterium]
MKKKILRITETAVLLALLVTLQWGLSALIPEPTTKQFVVGSAVNLILAVSVLVGGLWSGVFVALLSPLFAFLVGVIPGMQLPILPAICLGNLVYVLGMHFLIRKPLRNKGLWNTTKSIGGLIITAAAKFALLYFAVTKLIAALWTSNAGWNLAGVPPAMPAPLIAAMSWPQLVTALIGGALALVVAPLLWKALKR